MNKIFILGNISNDPDYLETSRPQPADWYRKPLNSWRKIFRKCPNSVYNSFVYYYGENQRLWICYSHESFSTYVVNIPTKQTYPTTFIDSWRHRLKRLAAGVTGQRVDLENNAKLKEIAELTSRVRGRSRVKGLCRNSKHLYHLPCHRHCCGYRETSKSTPTPFPYIDRCWNECRVEEWRSLKDLVETIINPPPSTLSVDLINENSHHIVKAAKSTCRLSSPREWVRIESWPGQRLPRWNPP